MEHRVVVSDTKATADAITAELDRVDATVETVTARTPEELVSAAADATAVIVDESTPVSREVFAALDTLRVVGRAGIGLDNVDLRAAAEAGVTVVNVPDYCVGEVSTHALALLLAVARSLPAYDAATAAGDWAWSDGAPVHRFRGRTLGLAGFGDINRRLARKVDGFGMDVLAYDPHVPAREMAHLDAEKAGFEELLAVANAVVVNLPLVEETRELFDAAAFETMPEGALFVNTARGGVVDETALIDALREGDLAGAGLDVLATEPPDGSPLLEMENVVVTPHAGWYSEESREQLGRSVAADVARVLAGERPQNPATPGDV